MRKLILIATVSLVASQAYAGGSRSLSLAATNASQATEQPPPAAQPTPAPAVIAPATVQTATTTPASTAQAAPVATAPQPTVPPIATTPRPKHREPSTEARVIRELHRHGIYW